MSSVAMILNSSEDYDLGVNNNKSKSNRNTGPDLEIMPFSLFLPNRESECVRISAADWQLTAMSGNNN